MEGDPGAHQEVEFPTNGVGEGTPTSKPLFSRWWPCSAQCETESQSSFNVPSPDDWESVWITICILLKNCLSSYLPVNWMEGLVLVFSFCTSLYMLDSRSLCGRWNWQHFSPILRVVSSSEDSFPWYAGTFKLPLIQFVSSWGYFLWWWSFFPESSQLYLYLECFACVFLQSCQEDFWHYNKVLIHFELVFV